MFFPSSKLHPLGSPSAGHQLLLAVGGLLPFIPCPSCTLFRHPSKGQRVGAQNSSSTLTFGWPQSALSLVLCRVEVLLCQTPSSVHPAVSQSSLVMCLDLDYLKSHECWHTWNASHPSSVIQVVPFKCGLIHHKLCSPMPKLQHLDYQRLATQGKHTSLLPQ